MLFSEYYQISLSESTVWFDPIMHQDTKLFIDPFLIFKNEFNEFIGSHSFMMDFFNKVFELIAASGGNKNSLSYKKAVRLLSFHEVNEICLGYSPTRDGAGTGVHSAQKMVDNIWVCINNGIVKLDHFEELGIFGVGIGRDRISDITANLLKDRLVKYTREICKNYCIDLSKVRLKNGKLDMEYLRWEHPIIELPYNPVKNTGLLLVPKIFLRELPEINKDDFWACVYDNEALRGDLNYEIDKNINKEEIARIAMNHPHLVKGYIAEVELRDGTPYDVNKDYKLHYRWYEKAKDVVANNPFKILPVKDETEFLELIKNLTSIFKHYIEEQSGYKLLWNNNIKDHKSEEAVQLLFRGIIEHYCKANDIDISREVNQGRGPVDFKFSNGYRKKLLLEIKLAKNTKFWNGINKQLPKYLKVESSKYGIFLVVIYRKNDYERIKNIQDVINEVNKKNNLNIEVVLIDATPNKPSASNL